MIDLEYRDKYWREAKRFVLHLLPHAIGLRVQYGDCHVAANRSLLVCKLDRGEERLTLGCCNRDAGMGWAWIYAAKRLGWLPKEASNGN